MRAQMAPWVREDVVAAEWFAPAKGMEDDGLAAVKWIRRRVSGGKRVDDRIRSCNVLVLTPTRLVAFAGRRVRATPAVEPKRQIGEWPLSRVKLSYRGRKAESYMAHAGGTYTSKIVRATLTLHGEDRPLTIDFPDTPLARELLEAAGKRVGIQA